MLRAYTQKARFGQSPDDASLPDARQPAWLHGVLGTWIALMVILAHRNERLYEALVQEDRLVEWLTVFLFVAASAAFGVWAVRYRRPGDGGVALFCLIAAGEEISWGQRLFGFVPAEAFLQRNAQQEANFHNLVEAFGQPKWTLIAVLVGYGLAVPALAATAPGARLARRLGVHVPSWSLAAWFAVAVALLLWYPVRFTGEWVEAIVGALFLAAAPLRPGVLGGALALSLLAAAVAARANARASASPELGPCAVAETRALLEDLLADTTASALQRDGRMHKRVYTMWTDGDLDSTHAAHFRSIVCATRSASVPIRIRYGVDPWGTAYWIRIDALDGGARAVTVYSFGPNRRRDLVADTAHAGDDILASGSMRR